MPLASYISEKTRSGAHKNRFSEFRASEDGSMTVLTCFFVFMMIMVCGIAVDLMRNELERTRVQNTLDRAILAASDLDQPLPADDVVDDYFAKAGMSDFLEDVNITPEVGQAVTNFRTVVATARAVTPSPYMELTGWSNLPVYAFGRAEETIENTEISLVIDISGSMRNSGKIGNLRTAAKEFIEAVLQGDAADTTSLSIIPYAGQVNPGPVVFNEANGRRFAQYYIDSDGTAKLYGYFLNDGEGNPLSSFIDSEGNPAPDGLTDAIRDASGNVITDGDGNPLENEDGGRIGIPYANISSCLELDDDDFKNIDLPNRALLDPKGPYDQTAYFMNWPIDWPTMNWGWCPQNDAAIQYAQNNIGTLKKFIDEIRLHDGTGTHYGMKYAVAALNPSSNDVFKELNKEGLVPDEFIDRPAAFNDGDTRKVIVLMTDGQITDQYRPKTTVDPRNDTDVLNKRTGDRRTESSRNTNLTRFYSMCDKAKAEKIQIYTIAFEAPSNAVTEMRNCATAPAFFYDVKGVEISAAFKSIARQINQLRLTQ